MSAMLCLPVAVDVILRIGEGLDMRQLPEDPDTDLRNFLMHNQAVNNFEKIRLSCMSFCVFFELPAVFQSGLVKLEA